MTRRLERVISGTLASGAGDIDLATVPTGEKWELREIVCSAYAFTDTLIFYVTDSAGSVIVGLYTVILPGAGASSPLRVTTVLYAGEHLHCARIASPNTHAVGFAITAIVVVI